MDTVNWKKKWLTMSLLFMSSLLIGCSTPEVEEVDIGVQDKQEVVEIDDEYEEIQEEPVEQWKTEEFVIEEEEEVPTRTTEPTSAIATSEITIVNNNIPYFSNDDITQTEAYHESGTLDEFGRVTAANAVVGVEIMPASGTRGDISGTTPTGWNQARYAGIGSGGWLYNRSHLIGHQMTGNDSPRNLMTGTRWFNMEMLTYENTVADYVERTENHVRYRVTPVFEGSNMLASGAYMEAFSIEDNGEGVMFNVYIPNIQPNVEIDYSNGQSRGPEGPVEQKDADDIVPYTPPADTSSSSGSQYVDEHGQGLIKGSKSGIYHIPGSTYYDRTTNPKTMFKSIEEAESAGYRAPK